MKSLWVKIGMVAIVAGLTAFGLGVVCVDTAEAWGNHKGNEVKSFCEAGVGTNLELSGEGGIWVQKWGAQTPEWIDCRGYGKLGLFNGEVKGHYVGQTSGLPTPAPGTVPGPEEPVVLHSPHGGSLVLTAYDEDGAVAGEIHAEGQGVFAFSLDPRLARVVGDVIVMKFGVQVDPSVSYLVLTVTETSGCFEDIEQAGDWAIEANGEVYLQRDEDNYPDLGVNIGMALSNSDLILGGTQQIVLTGFHKGEVN